MRKRVGDGHVDIGCGVDALFVLLVPRGLSPLDIILGQIVPSDRGQPGIQGRSMPLATPTLYLQSYGVRPRP